MEISNVNSMKVLSVGSSVPERVVTNDDLSKLVDTDDEWITTRTGIRRRHLAEPGTTTLDLAAAATRQALQSANMTIDDIDVIVAASSTPDLTMPALAPSLHHRLGMREQVFSYDIHAACCGFLFALRSAQGQLALNRQATVLVVASELMSRVLDFTDRSTCVLFGDGAGAVIVRAEGEQAFFTSSTCGNPSAIEIPLYYDAPVPGVRMRGQEVFRFACNSIERSIRRLLDEAGLTLADINHVICHQANARIINHVAKRMNAREMQFFLDVEEYGNTSSASIALALADLNRSGRLERGQRVILVGFGSGLVEGGMLLTW